jgi:hypothetical protein
MMKVAFTVAVVLSISSIVLATAGAPIDQMQNSNIGIQNTLTLLQGHQAGDAIQNLAVANDQHATRACGAYGNQSFLANLAEIGHASGDCAIVGVLQHLTTVGIQAQLIGDCCDAKSEGQSLNMLAEQGLTKSEGPGAGSGLHQIVLQAGQGGANPAGGINQAAAILGLQSSNIDGSACATGAVSSVMNVCTVQSQATE